MVPIFGPTCTVRGGFEGSDCVQFIIAKVGKNVFKHYKYFPGGLITFVNVTSYCLSKA